jgi:hypothetical protein
VVQFISEKANIKPKLVRRYKGHFIMIKRTIHQEYITIIKTYTTNFSTPNFIKQTLLYIKADRS